MYLNGERLKEAARLRKLSRKEIEQQSGLPASDIAYYWENAVTVASQEHIDALAKALGIRADLLVVKGEPKGVALRSDKFVSQEDDIEVQK